LLAFVAWHLANYRKVIGSLCIFSTSLILIAPFIFAYFKEPKTDKRICDRYSQATTVNKYLKDSSKPVFLYKRFEEISSLLFYYNKPLPIIHSESHDLAYGQITKLNPDAFVTEEVLKTPCIVVVLDRDLPDFHTEMTHLHISNHALTYKLYKINIFEVN
jgi:hypothetical protein